MADTALYYPYIHFRDDAWVKAAALFWPRLARLLPRDYPTDDSDTVRCLRDELGFVVDVAPRGGSEEVARSFQGFVESHERDLVERFGLNEKSGLPAPETMSPSYGAQASLALGWIHVDKMTFSLAEYLIDAGIAQWGRAHDMRWIGLHPRLASVYSCALAEHIATTNKIETITDQVLEHGALNGWGAEALAAAVLGGDDHHAGPPGEAKAAFVVLALRSVIPQGLEHIPPGEIVRVRKTLQQEFFEFRTFVDSLASRFAEIVAMPDPSLADAELRSEFEREVTIRVEALKKGMRKVGWAPASSLLSRKAPVSPAAFGAAVVAASAAGVAGSAGATLTAATVGAGVLLDSAVEYRTARKSNRQAAASSPVGYLLGLERQLRPAGVVAKVRSVLNRTPSN